MSLSHISTEDLEKEIARRRAKDDVKSSIQPLPFDEARYKKFSLQIEQIVNDLISGEDKDAEHWVYEEALVLIYGQDIFTKLSQLY